MWLNWKSIGLKVTEIKLVKGQKSKWTLREQFHRIQNDTFLLGLTNHLNIWLWYKRDYSQWFIQKSAVFTRTVQCLSANCTILQPIIWHHFGSLLSLTFSSVPDSCFHEHYFWKKKVVTVVTVCYRKSISGCYISYKVHHLMATTVYGLWLLRYGPCSSIRFGSGPVLGYEGWM